MNHKLKTQFVALMAILSGTALGNCQAMQAEANPSGAVGSGVIRPAEPTHGESFGAVTSTSQFEYYGDESELPPIVSPAYAIAESEKQMMATLPPIVTPFKAAQNLAKSDQTPPAKKSNMLAPLAQIQPASSPFAKTAKTYSPAPVIQATGEPVDIKDDQLVKQATQWGPKNQSLNGVSAAGVPIYPQVSSAGFTAPQGLPQIVQGPALATSATVPPIVRRAAGSNPMPPTIKVGSEMVAPNPMTSVGPYPSANRNLSYFNSPPREAPAVGADCGCGSSSCASCSNCNSCGGNGCTECGVANSATGVVSGCQSCGQGGCYNDNQVAARFDACGSVYSARRYLIVDGVYIDRYDGTIAVSNFGGLNNFEEEIGLAVTLGRRNDATSGQEFTYFGTPELEQTAVHTDPAGRISIGMANSGGFATTELSAFRNATEQAQAKETELHSIEFNRVRWGWDVVKTFIGAQYIYIEDDYSIASQNLIGETGLFEVTTHNNLFGLHWGSEIFYDVGYRLSASLVNKWGLYVNPNKVDTRLNNAGAQFLDLEDTNTAVGYKMELGAVGRYQLSRRARMRFGYIALFLGNTAGVSDNIPVILTPTTGSDTSDSGEMFFHGLSIGFEIYR